MTSALSVREITVSDIPLIADYWTTSSDSHLKSMGVDLDKIPDRENFISMLENQLSLPIQERNAVAFIWEMNGKPIGHCNTNPTKFGGEANMHLHIWKQENQKRNIGTELLKKTIPLLFEKLELNRLYCEPYALNPAPNRILEKVGFAFVKEYVTVPGSINFEQPVKQWLMIRESALKLFN